MGRFAPFVTPAATRAFVRRGARLALAELPVPSPGPGEVLVLVMAAGVAFAPADAAGVVWRLGEGVTRWNVGDEIVVSPSVACGACGACTGFGRGGCDRPAVWGGALSELSLAKAEQLVRKPPHLTWEQAGSYASAYFGAYHALVDRAKVRPGDAVLVLDGARPFGAFAIQLARLLGASVGTIAPGPRKGRAQRITDEVQAAFGRAPDVVLVGAGEGSLRASLALSARRARILVAEGAGADPIDTAVLRGDEKTILGVSLAPSEECQRANELVHQRKISVPAPTSYAFEDVPTALRAERAGLHASAPAACLVAAEASGATTAAEDTGDRRLRARTKRTRQPAAATC